MEETEKIMDKELNDIVLFERENTLSIIGNREEYEEASIIMKDFYRESVRKMMFTKPNSAQKINKKWKL